MLDDEALAALAHELAALYLQSNDIDPERGEYDRTLAWVVEHAMTYAFRLGFRSGYQKRVPESVN